MGAAASARSCRTAARTVGTTVAKAAATTAAWAAALVAIAASAGSGCNVEAVAFRCVSDAQCVVAEASAGHCEATGYCSFDDRTCATTRRRYGIFAAPALAGQCVAPILPAIVDGVFTERFAWSGAHAATTSDGNASTVWWDLDQWLARSDTSLDSIEFGGGVYVDVHRSSGDVADGTSSDGTNSSDAYYPGGDASYGVGIMHVDENSVVSVRLRNPALLDAATPLVIELYASSFVTRGHWWELAISPTYVGIGGEFTTLAHAMDAREDSLNIAIRGTSDTPCQDGWGTTISAARSRNGARTSIGSQAIAHEKRSADRLSIWRFSFSPAGAVVAVDLDDDGAFETEKTFAVDLSDWNEVNLHLIAVADDASAHPQGEGSGDNVGCIANQGSVRDFAWKNLKVSTVKYDRMMVYPKPTRVQRVPRDMGWMSYDLRDTARRGVSHGRGQPNAGPYDRRSSLAFCSDATRAGCDVAIESKELTLSLSATDAANIAYAALVYDVRGDGTAELWVNDQSAGVVLNALSVFSLGGDQWVPRSHRIDPLFFHEGDNSIELQLSGDIQFDRLELEFGY